MRLPHIKCSECMVDRQHEDIAEWDIPNEYFICRFCIVKVELNKKDCFTAL